MSCAVKERLQPVTYSHRFAMQVLVSVLAATTSVSSRAAPLKEACRTSRA